MHKPRAMAEMNLDTMAYEPWCIWLKEVDTSEYQNTAWTLLEILGRLTQLRIENSITFAAPSKVVKYLTSSFLHVLRCFRSSFFKCSRFPYQESVINEWFTLSSDGDLREQDVNVINLVKNAGTNGECSAILNQVRDFLESLLDNNFEVFFHGTRHSYAQDIIQNGIDVKQGRTQQDFSNGDGFYVGGSFDEACKWTGSRGHPNSAVLVFRVKKTELRGENEKGLDLRGNRKEWQKVVWQFRSGSPDRKFIKSLKKYEFIEGPMASLSSKNPRPTLKDDTYQLCIRKDVCAGLFDQSLHSVVFFDSQ